MKFMGDKSQIGAGGFEKPSELYIQPGGLTGEKGSAADVWFENSFFLSDPSSVSEDLTSDKADAHTSVKGQNFQQGLTPSLRLSFVSVLSDVANAAKGSVWKEAGAVLKNMVKSVGEGISSAVKRVKEIGQTSKPYNEDIIAVVKHQVPRKTSEEELPKANEPQNPKETEEHKESVESSPSEPEAGDEAVIQNASEPIEPEARVEVEQPEAGEPQKPKENVELSPARQKWESAVGKAKILGKGSLEPGAKVLSKAYWKEAIGLKFEIDGKSYEGHFYPGHLIKHITAWETKTNPDTGKPFQEEISFEDYMNKIVIPGFSKIDAARFIDAMDAKSVEYYTKEQLEGLRVSFDHEGGIMTPGNSLNEWTKALEDLEMVKGLKLSKEELGPSSYLEFCQKNETNLASKELTPLKNGGEYMFVLDKGELFIQKKQAEKAHHSSLGGGEAAIAGTLTVDDYGKITAITDESGHYQPTVDQIVIMLEYLDKKNAIDYQDFGVVLTKANPRVIKKGEQVKAWKAEKKEAIVKELEGLGAPISEKALKDTSYASLVKFRDNIKFVNQQKQSQTHLK